MAFGTGQLTFSAVTTPEPLSATSIKVARVIIQQVPTNSAVIEFGKPSFTYGQGIRLVVPAATILDKYELKSLNGLNTIDLSELYVAGAISEKVNYFYEQF